MSDVDRALSEPSDALALAAAAEAGDERWAWILEALLVHQDDGETLAEALVTGAHLNSA